MVKFQKQLRLFVSFLKMNHNGSGLAEGLDFEKEFVNLTKI